MILLSVSSWDAFKTLVSDKELRAQYGETATTYEVYGNESVFVWTYSILKGSDDATDFEDNHQANYNKKLSENISDTYVQEMLTVGTTEVAAAVSTNTSDKRSFLYIENKSNTTIYYGPSGLTTTNGAALGKGQCVLLNFSKAVEVYLIAATSGNNVLVQEAS